MDRHYEDYKKIIDEHLLDFIPNIDNKSISLYESMKYSLTAGGKRIRPVLLLAAWLLSLTGEVNNIWWAFLIAEFVSAALCTIFFIRDYNRKLKHLGE